MEIYNEKVSDLLSSEDKIIKIQEDTVRLFIYVSFFLVLSILKHCLFNLKNKLEMTLLWKKCMCD